ncbi:hypothetical protein EDD15DRAFT_2375764 [Pisolithus albus]|nr:hypothetical protein EDD15DRAFT_2375764 [Pisolithus albus]
MTSRSLMPSSLNASARRGYGGNRKQQLRPPSESAGREKKPNAERGKKAQCTFELAKASKRGKRLCDRCTGLKQQCKLLGVAKEGKVGKRVPEDQTSPRASEKKKRARARSPEVEVVGGPSKMPEAESGGGGLVGALHAIAEAIDQHTEEMQEHRRLAKSQHETQRWFNNHLWELLQETEYRRVETDESEGDDTSEGEPEGSKSSDDMREEGMDAEAEV